MATDKHRDRQTNKQTDEHHHCFKASNPLYAAMAYNRNKMQQDRVCCVRRGTKAAGWGECGDRC